MPALLKLPTERVDQLRNLARHYDLTVADTIGLLVRKEIDEGHLPDEVPGFSVQRQGPHVRFSFAEGVLHEFTRGQASEIADTIEEIARGDRRGTFLLDSLFAITRVGTGIKLAIGGETKVIAPDVARDLARVVRRAAG